MQISCLHWCSLKRLETDVIKRVGAPWRAQLGHGFTRLASQRRGCWSPSLPHVVGTALCPGKLDQGAERRLTPCFVGFFSLSGLVLTPPGSQSRFTKEERGQSLAQDLPNPPRLPTEVYMKPQSYFDSAT